MSFCQSLTARCHFHHAHPIHHFHHFHHHLSSQPHLPPPPIFTRRDQWENVNALIAYRFLTAEDSRN